MIEVWKLIKASKKTILQNFPLRKIPTFLGFANLLKICYYNKVVVPHASRRESGDNKNINRPAVVGDGFCFSLRSK